MALKPLTAYIVAHVLSPPQPPKRDGAATRQKLIRAALELFTTVGFRATTTPEIAARAEVAEGTIYRHFSGKEELLLAAYREAQAWGLEQIRGQEAERTLPPRDRLLSVAKRLVGAARTRSGHDPDAAPAAGGALPR